MKVPLLSWFALAVGCLLVVTAYGFPASSSRTSAFLAQAWIGPGVKTQVVRIVNHASGPTRYPAEFHGLVVAFADILWLYTEFDGTQNLSFQRGRVAEDEANLGTLLQAVEPGLVAFAVDTDPPPVLGKNELLPNRCFPACLARWNELQREKHPPLRARLIACFAPDQRSGHMVLEYWRKGRRYVFDPDRPGRDLRLPDKVGEQALAVAAVAMRGRWTVAPARATPVELLRTPARQLLAGEAAPGQTRS